MTRDPYPFAAANEPPITWREFGRLIAVGLLAGIFATGFAWAFMDAAARAVAP